jgi:DNA polymerase III subunit alpha, Gram-positive type
MNPNLLANKLQEQDFVALDLETTGFEVKKSEIIEIAAIRFTKNGEVSRFHQFVKPTRGLALGAMIVNGITESQLANSPQLGDILPNFLNFLEDSILVIQNAEFDLGFLLYESEIRQLKFPTLPVICTVQLSRKLFPKIKHNLVALREEFNILSKKERSDLGQNIHEGMDDTYAAGQVFRICLEKINGWEKKFSEVWFHEKNWKLTDDYTQKSLFS